MAIDTDPQVGSWYEDLETEGQFQVLDIDEDAGLVEIQYLDGDTDEIDLDDWYTMDLQGIKEPEEWGEDAEDSEEEGDYDEDEDQDEEDEDEGWSGGRRRRSSDEGEEFGGDWDED